MSNLDLVGILQTYALKIAHCDNDERIIKIIKDLKEELNIKRIRKELKDE